MLYNVHKGFEQKHDRPISILIVERLSSTSIIIEHRHSIETLVGTSRDPHPGIPCIQRSPASDEMEFVMDKDEEDNCTTTHVLYNCYVL